MHIREQCGIKMMKTNLYRPMVHNAEQLSMFIWIKENFTVIDTTLLAYNDLKWINLLTVLINSLCSLQISNSTWIFFMDDSSREALTKAISYVLSFFFLVIIWRSFSSFFSISATMALICLDTFCTCSVSPTITTVQSLLSRNTAIASGWDTSMDRKRSFSSAQTYEIKKG